MRTSGLSLIAALALLAAGTANATPIAVNSGDTNPNIVNVVAGCKLGFHPAYYGCAPNAYRVYRHFRPRTDVIDEWDVYDYYY